MDGRVCRRASDSARAVDGREIERASGRTDERVDMQECRREDAHAGVQV